MRHDVTLQDGDLILRPLTEEDIPALCALASSCLEELRHMGSAPNVPAYYEAALSAPDQLPFVIEVQGERAGSTRLADLRQRPPTLESGYSWLTPAYLGSGINKRAKRLLLTHAFEALGVVRVQLHTDIRNVRSQRAIEKLGAVREGVLRKHRLRPDGSLRDSVLYSITGDEWPGVKAGLGAP